jgi:dolichol-phosphate mannosyltransferase
MVQKIAGFNKHTIVEEQEDFGVRSRPDITVIVPTRNEAGNVEPLLTRVEKSLENISAEVIFVDDSTDNTPQVVQQAVGRFGSLKIGLIHRPPEARTGGLGGAVVAGMYAAKASYVCVMDGDLQHPPELIPQLLEKAHQKQADLVVASRRTAESEVKGLNLLRDLISRGLDLTARLLFHKELHGVSDPLTGFFLVRLAAVDLDSLRPQGFKILLEILVRNPELVKAELPFRFGERVAGVSKASAREVTNYLGLLWKLRFGDSSIRFTKFIVVGGSGIFVNSAVMALATDSMHIHYMISAILATVASTTWNFALTEWWVFKAGSEAGGRLKRFFLFFVMNNVALLFRSPIIYVLTSMLGVYYLISNLVSLVVLTVARYLLADNLIWEKPTSENQQPKWTAQFRF